YHCKCIDPWLTKIRKVCPICKRKVLSSGESDSSDSENEGRDSTSASGSTTVYRENAPLLRNAEAFASGSPSASNQRVEGRRNMHDGQRPPLRVIITSPAGTSLPAPGTGYLIATDGETRETSSTTTISSRFEAVSETLRRTLRPYYQQIVNRSRRVPWRNAPREPECAPAPNTQRPFVVDNNAFDQSSEALNIAQSSSVADRRDLEAVGVFPSEGIAVTERSHPVTAASSGTTGFESGSVPEVELPIDNQQNNLFLIIKGMKSGHSVS
ncbi:unnamed protein product, partial [Onchocerca flexuosa]|uniref:RING-type domain-containing protein n=1 Tax=Onchocerca flexuosa TaxID=387005 RepID=A0A183HN47_9BILA